MSADKQGNPASRVLFNSAFTNNNPVAYFRGTNGPASRVSTWILGNNSAQSTTGSTSDCTNDYSFGVLDALVGNLTLGMSEKAAASGSGSGNGTFTFAAGTNNVNNLYLGYGLGNTGTSVGNGTMNVNGTATLIANNAICLCYWTSPSTSYGNGNLNINGGTVMAGTITNGTTAAGSVGYVNANITMNGGTLGITSLLGSIGTAAWPLGIVTLNNATLQLPVSGLQTNVEAVILNAGGTNNTINISSVPPTVITYNTQFPLISYQQLQGSFNFTLGTLPGTYQGYLSNNTANSSIDLVLTNGPTTISQLAWSGAANGNWDTASLNWLNGSSPSTYADGAEVLFDDSATGPTAINLTQIVSPTSVTVNNNTLPYAFGGSGAISGTGGLTMNGSGTLLVTNSGVNNFSGNVVINSGTIQFGAGTPNGILPPTGSVTDNGNLVFDRSDNFSLPNVISGTGTLTQNGPDVLTVMASNSLSGPTLVNTGTLLVNGVLSGVLTSQAGSTIGGAGTNAGPVNVGGTIQASAASATPTTFTSGNLNLAAGATLAFDLNGPDATVGQGSNDLLNVVGNLTANNNVIALNFAGVPQTSTPYTLINYSGTVSGSFNPTVTGTHYAATVNQGSGTVSVNLAGSGANLKWDCATNNGFWTVGGATNWLNQGSGSPDVFYDGDSVLFDDSSASTALTISSGVSVAPAAMVVNSSVNNFTINGGGQITGSGTLTKLGSSTLIVNTPNHGFTGNALIEGGTFQAGNNAALVSATTTVSSGATLDIHGFAYVNGPQVVTVSGAGVGGNGALVNYGADQQDAYQNITLAGDTTVGGTGRMDMRQSGSNPLTLTSANGNPYNLTVVGTTIFNLVSVTVDQNLGNVDIKGGTFGLQVNTLVNSQGWAGDSTKTITVETNGTLAFYELGATVALNRSIVLNDGATMLNQNGIGVVSGTVSLLGKDTFDVAFEGTTPSLTLSGLISGPGSLIKTDTATLILQGTDTYTGSTLVEGGSLQLGATGGTDGAIPDSTNIVIAAGAIVDVSQRSDQTLTLAAGQTLQGSGTINGALVVGAGATVSAGTNASNVGQLTVTNGVVLQGNTLMKLNPASLASDKISVSASANITYGGTLTLTNVSGSAFAGGNSFTLFSANNTGSFTSIIPATPGAGLAWNTNNLANGILSVVASSTPQPGITGITISGTSLVINGTNGVAGESYNVLTSTNLALPLAQWTVLPTGQFSAGSFNITNTLTPGAAQSYYIIQVP
jgi:autotransporter-associated beta strand protein